MRRPSGVSWSIGIDHSRSAEGIVGLGTPCPSDHALVSTTCRQSSAIASARRTRTSRNGSRSSFIAMIEPNNTTNSWVFRFGLRWRATGRSTRRTHCPYSGAKSKRPASQLAIRDDGSSSTVTSIPSAYGSPGRSEEHTSEPSHVRISYAVFCLKKKTNHYITFPFKKKKQKTQTQ